MDHEHHQLLVCIIFVATSRNAHQTTRLDYANTTDYENGVLIGTIHTHMKYTWPYCTMAIVAYRSK